MSNPAALKERLFEIFIDLRVRKKITEKEYTMFLKVANEGVNAIFSDRKRSK